MPFQIRVVKAMPSKDCELKIQGLYLKDGNELVTLTKATSVSGESKPACVKTAWLTLDCPSVMDIKNIIVNDDIELKAAEEKLKNEGCIFSALKNVRKSEGAIRFRDVFEYTEPYEAKSAARPEIKMSQMVRKRANKPQDKAMVATGGMFATNVPAGSASDLDSSNTSQLRR